jgi:hypothetical protein
MTTSERASNAAARHGTGTDMTPDPAPPDAAAADRKPETGEQASSVTTGPPDDIHELRQEIEQAREQLGETVQQLAAKTDVKARARGKAAELTRKVKSRASQAQVQAASRAGNVRARGVGIARRRRTSLLTAGATLVSGWLVVRWWRRR